MRRMHRAALASAASLLGVACWGAQTTEQVAAETETGVPTSTWDAPATTGPSLISRPQITSPDSSREAMVYVQFLVSPEGNPMEVAVQEERGFHTERFREEALRYVRGMRFKPATRDGVPVVYGPMTQPINFGFGLPKEEQGVTPGFRRELTKVEKFLKDGDYAGAHFHAEWMLSEKVKLGYEFAVLQAQLAQTYASVGRLDEALTAVKAATSRTSSESAGFKIGEPPPRNDASRYLLPKELIIYLLDLRMRLLAQHGEVLGALKTYNELAGLEKLESNHPLTELSEKLIGLLQSGNALAFPGEVQAKNEFWSHELFHPRFTTRNVRGKLGIVHLHCRGHFDQFPHEVEKIWDVPPGRENCVVEFYGEPGAKLQLVELPAD